MLNRIILWSIQNKLIVAVLTFFIIVWGILSLQNLPIDAVPDITNNQVQIVTSSPTSGAEDIERFVTFPVEQSMATIPGIEEIRSFSRFGLSVVTIVFDEETDPYWARQQVSERLIQVKGQIPSGYGEPSMAPMSTGLGEIYQYVVRAKKGYEKKYSKAELRTIQDWIIRRQLLGVPGVADVSGFGGEVKTYEIALDPLKLKSLGLSVSDVFDAVEKNSGNTGGAYIEKNNLTTYIKTEGLLKSIQEIEQIRISSSNAKFPIFIRDVAKVSFGSLPRFGALTFDDQGEAVGGIVLMLKGANSSEVIKSVKERMEQIKKTLPEGIEIDVYLDRTHLVDRAISTVTTNLIEGALIVILILVLILGNLRAGLIVASVIPLSMLIAISLMNIFNVSGNLMSLGALDFGLIIDGAVIIVESTLHFLHLKQKKSLTNKEMDETVYMSASKFSSSAIFGQLIILVVYLPILALVGIEGKMFMPMAQTVMFAIIGALLLSFTYVPMMSSVFLSKKISHKKTFSDRIVEKIKSFYLPILLTVIKKKKLVLVFLVSFFIGSIALFSTLGSEFIPNLDEGDFAVEMRLMTGSSLTKTIESTQKASKMLLEEFPEVKSVVGKIGTAEIPTDPMPMEACDLMIILKPKDEWTSATTKDELAEKMQNRLETILPGVSFGFQQPIQMRFNELMTGAKQDVVVKIYGEDFIMLEKYAKQIGGIAGKINGVQDVYVEEMTGLPQMTIRYHREQLAKYQVSVEEINRAVNISLAGQPTGLVFEGEKRFDLVIKLDEASRHNIQMIEQIHVVNEEGTEIPISELAEISVQEGPNQIQRDDAKRRIIVGFNVRGRDVASIVEELKTEISRQVEFTPGYYPTYGGTFKNLENAQKRLLIAVPASLLLIFFLLFLAFRSVKQATLIFSAIPLAAIGGIVALWIRDMPFSISAGVGFIALFGVAVLNGIVLISEFNSLKSKGSSLSFTIVRGTLNRLRPVLLTASVASLGFVPMAFSMGSGAEVQKPLATVVIGGLISATILTLFILPILYAMFEKISFKNRKPAALSVLVIIFFNSFQGFSQYDQQQLIDYMKKNSSEIESIRLNSEIARQSKLGLMEVPKTSLNGMFGQYNSYSINDNNITINQTIPFPSVFQSFIKMSNNEQAIENENLYWKIRERELAIYTLFDAFRACEAKKREVINYSKSLDTLSQLYELKKKAGEISTIDISAITIKKMRQEAVLNSIENDLLNLKSQLKSVVGMRVDENFELIINDDYEVIIVDKMKDSLAQRHWKEKNVNLIQQKLLLEKRYILNQQLPEFNLGYFNQTLIGSLPPNLGPAAGADKRFQGVMFGVNVPLFWNGFHHKQKELTLQMEKNQLDFETSTKSFQINYKNLYDSYNNQFLLVENRRLLLSNEMKNLKSQLELKKSNGDISNFELLQLNEELLEIELNFIETKQKTNEIGIMINWINKILENENNK